MIIDGKQIAQHLKEEMREQVAVKSAILGSLDLASDIGHTSRILTDNDYVQARFATILSGQGSNLLTHLFL